VERISCSREDSNQVSKRTEDIVKEYRERRIEGKFVDLVPFSADDIDHVVEIRNREKNRYFLNQTSCITTEGQTKWYESYLERFDDIYWCVYNKSNQFIGTIRVYAIDEENDICDQGSLMIDENYASEAPYAVEVELLTLDFIFDVLRIGNVINEDRADNKVMNNMTKRLGFKFIEDTKVGEVDYKYYLLSPDDYKVKREVFVQLVECWDLNR